MDGLKSFFNKYIDVNVGLCHHEVARPQVADGGHGLYIWRVAANEAKRPLGRRRRRWESNTIMDLRVIGWEGVDWIHLAQDRDQWRAVVITLMNLRVL
jgi:hypothetical protein